jgi:hypothetical protein
VNEKRSMSDPLGDVVRLTDPEFFHELPVRRVRTPAGRSAGLLVDDPTLLPNAVEELLRSAASPSASART